MSERVVSRRVYYWVFAVLTVLLVLTVAVALVDLGPLNPAVAMAIAAAKAALIVLFFMHVWYGSQLTRVFAIAGFLWLAILLGLMMSDYLTRSISMLYAAAW